MMKHCPACKIHKAFSLFYKNRSQKDGLTNYCKSCHSISTNRTRSRQSVERKREHLLARYGLTLEDFEILQTAQDGRCAICSRLTERLCVDHDHNTDEVRGLLCQQCNSILGYAGDSVDILLNAIAYLENES